MWSGRCRRRQRWNGLGVIYMNAHYTLLFWCWCCRYCCSFAIFKPVYASECESVYSVRLLLHVHILLQLILVALASIQCVNKTVKNWLMLATLYLYMHWVRRAHTDTHTHRVCTEAQSTKPPEHLPKTVIICSATHFSLSAYICICCVYHLCFASCSTSLTRWQSTFLAPYSEL